MKKQTNIDQNLISKVNRELKDAGVTEFGLKRFTSSYLPQVIRPDEHIMAAVFGRRKETEGFFGFVEGLLVATDKRIIFIDHRPGFTTMDEVTYDVVSGVNLSSTIFYASITLFTRVTNYQVSFASLKCAQRFADYIELRKLDSTQNVYTPAYA